MKQFTLLLAALVTGASLSAQTPVAAPAAPSYSITVDFPYAGKYCFRAIKYAAGSFQPSVKLTTGNFYAGIWSNIPVDKGYELEVDYYVGYTFPVDVAGWTMDAGATIYQYPGLDVPGADNLTLEGYIGLNGTVGVLASGTYAYYDFNLKVFTIQQTLGYNVTVNDRASVNFLGTLGYAAPDVGDSYTYYGFGLTVPYKLSDALMLTAGAQYATHNLDGVEDGHFWGTIGLTYAF